MLGIGLCDRNKVFCVDDNSAFLHDSERALGAGLLYIPYKFILKTLNKQNK